MKKFFGIFMIVAAVIVTAAALVCGSFEIAAGAAGAAGAIKMTAGMFTPEQFERMAEQYFTSFEGFEGGYAYDGSRDDMMDFGNAGGGFLNENALKRQFIMVIINSDNTNAKEVYLTPGGMWFPGYGAHTTWKAPTIKADDLGTGVPATDYTVGSDGLLYFGTNRGFVTDGDFWGIGETPAIGTSTLNGAGNPKTIKDFFAFINSNPTNLIGLRVSSSVDDDMQSNYTLEVESQSPFRTLQSDVLHPSTYIDQSSYQKSIVKFETPGIILSNQTRIKYTIAAKRTVTITFMCGGVLNTAESLNKKRGNAVQAAANVIKVNAPGAMMQKPLKFETPKKK